MSCKRSDTSHNHYINNKKNNIIIIIDPIRIFYLDIVLDNSGYEFFTDMCLMDLIITFSMAKKVNFHVKAIPWFISDVTENDFYWTLNQLSQSGDENMKNLGIRWAGNVFLLLV